jgi:hypothetical protein
MSVLNNGYMPRGSGLLVRPDAETSDVDTYLPANYRLDTIPRGFPPIVSAPPLRAVTSAVTSKADEAPASGRVRRARRRATVEGQLADVPDTKIGLAQRRMDRAVELEALAANPRAEAWSNRRQRAWMLGSLAVIAGGGAVLSAIFSALSVSTALRLDGGVWFSAAMGPDLLMGGLMALSLVMRAVIAQRGLSIAPESDAAYRKAEMWLGGLIAVITVGPSLGGAITAGVAWGQKGGTSGAFGWALVAVAVHSIGPAVVWTSAALAPHITGDLARISQHTAQRLADMDLTSGNTTFQQVAVDKPATSGKARFQQVNGRNAATSGKARFQQVNGRNAATSGNADQVIIRARRELGSGVSGTQVARWHRTNIGPISQERIGEIRNALNASQGQ